MLSADYHRYIILSGYAFRYAMFMLDAVVTAFVGGELLDFVGRLVILERWNMSKFYGAGRSAMQGDSAGIRIH